MFLSSYTFKFFRHVEKFMTLEGLLPPSGKLIVACSTGLDSIVLLEVGRHLLAEGLIRALEVVHVNHGTRPECAVEEEFLRSFCQKANLTLHVKKLAPDLEALSNFEAWARTQRYSYFRTLIQKGDTLATAHHLDDSFEWWLMQQMKTTNPHLLGIPVKNQQVVRPFLCVTKKQITTFAQKNDLKYFVDSSNNDLRFERNFLRAEIIPTLARKYPGYLKHYALRSNLRLKEQKLNRKTFFHAKIDPDYGIHLRFEETPSVEELVSLIKKVSTKERGVLRAELQKLILSLESGGHGPMHFSGGVKIFFNRSEMLIVNQHQLLSYALLDEQLTTSFVLPGKWSKVSAEGFLATEALFPRLCITREPWVQQSVAPMKKIHPLFPRFTAMLLQNNLWFCSANQLKQYCLKHPRSFTREISIINLRGLPNLT